MSEASAPAPGDLKRRIVVRSLPCRGCGYDLRGLRIDRRCPECGRDVLGSVLEAVDPESAGLPLIRNPYRVGDGLLWLVGCLVAATLLIVVRPLAAQIDAATGGRSAGLLVLWRSPVLELIAGVIVLLALPAVGKLAPPRGREPRGAVWRDLYRLSIGLVAWGVLLIGAWWWPRWGAGLASLDAALPIVVARSVLNLAMVAAVVLVLVAIQNILRVIGERSREYRNASGGRQRVRDMMAAAVGIALGETLRLVGAVNGRDGFVTVGMVMIWICTFMLVIGLLYLLVNAWWIRRSLRRPPARLWGVLGADGVAASDADVPPAAN